MHVARGFRLPVYSTQNIALELIDKLFSFGIRPLPLGMGDRTRYSP